MKDMKKKMKYGAGKRAMLRTNMMPMGGGAKKNKEPVIEMEQARVERMYGGGKVK